MKIFSGLALEACGAKHHTSVLLCRDVGKLGTKIVAALSGLALKACQAKYSTLVMSLLPALSALAAAVPGLPTDDLACIFTNGAH